MFFGMVALIHDVIMVWSSCFSYFVKLKKIDFYVNIFSTIDVI